MSIVKSVATFLFLTGWLVFLTACAGPAPTPVPGPTSTLESPATAPSQPDPTLSDPTLVPPPAQETLFPTPDPSPTEPPALPTNTPGPSPTPLAASIFGLEVNPVSDKGGLALVQETDTSWVRGISISWQEIEPVPGARNWEALASTETEILNAVENGLTPILLVLRAPVWARLDSNFACGPIHPDELGAFADFLQDLVQRYSQPPYQVRFWEIWNEPDVGLGHSPGAAGFGCWGDPEDQYYGGGRYAGMLKAVYPAVKAADPAAQVLLGGLLLDCDPEDPPESPPGSGTLKDCSSGKFLRGVLENGGGAFFDAVSFHAYDYYYFEAGQYGNPNWHSSWDESGPVLVAKTRYLQKLLQEYGVGDKPLLNTELGLLCGSTGKEDTCQTETFNNTKAYYLAQAYALAMVEGLDANLWYSLRGWRGTGFVRVNLEPLPVYDAYQFSTRQLAGAAFAEEISLYPGVKGLQFIRDGKELWLLWSLDGQNHEILLPNRPEAVYDVFGEALESARNLTVTVSPVYIIWP